MRAIDLPCSTHKTPSGVPCNGAVSTCQARRNEAARVTRDANRAAKLASHTTPEDKEIK